MVANQAADEVEMAVQDADLLAQAVDVVPAEIQDKIMELLCEVGHLFSHEELARAVSQIKRTVVQLGPPAKELLVQAGAICSRIGQSIAEHAPDVVMAIANVLGGLGKHLPIICHATALLGEISFAFFEARLIDVNARNIMSWTTSVYDWLILVSNRVNRSGAESSIQLFEELQNQLSQLCKMCRGWDSRWLVTKMVMQHHFRRKLETTRRAVIELKAALRDYLDAEAVVRQEQIMASLEDTVIYTQQKLEEVSDQIKENTSTLDHVTIVADSTQSVVAHNAEALNQVTDQLAELKKMMAQNSTPRAYGGDSKGEANRLFDQMLQDASMPSGTYVLRLSSSIFLSASALRPVLPRDSGTLHQHVCACGRKHIFRRPRPYGTSPRGSSGGG